MESSRNWKTFAHSVEGLVFFFLLLLIDYRIFAKVSCHLSKKPQAVEEEDTDVAEQKELMRNYSEDKIKSNYVSAGKDLTKYYGKKLAVNGLSLGVKHYECFGLLGMSYQYVAWNKFNIS